MPSTIRYSTENMLANRNRRSLSCCLRGSTARGGVSIAGMDAMVTRISNSRLTWIEHTLLLAVRDLPAYVHRDVGVGIRRTPPDLRDGDARNRLQTPQARPGIP